MENGFLAEMQKENWAMEPKALNAFFSQVSQLQAESYLKAAAAFGVDGVTVDVDRGTVNASFTDLNDLSDMRIGATIEQTDYAKYTAKTVKVTLDGDTAIIPINGVLMKTVPAFFKYFGIEATAYGDITSAIESAVADDEVNSIALHITSPGGTVSGVQEAGDAIFAARDKKPVNAFIEDLGASAAFWLGSQANTITSNELAEVGSIGVYTVFIDLSKMAENDGIKVHLVSSGEHKGMGTPGVEITPEQLATEQEIIDGIANIFVKTVARGRGMKTKEVADLATGRLWLAGESKKVGLIDKVDTFNSMLASVSAGTLAQGETGMGDNTIVLTDEDIAAAEKAAEDKVKAEEQDRFKALKSEFADDLKYASEAFEKGLNVEQAKAEYCDVLVTKNAELEKSIADLETKIADLEKHKKDSGEPVDHGEAPTGVKKTVMEIAADLRAADPKMSKKKSQQEAHKIFNAQE
jgi:signal peptide peptidase SppA